MDKIEELLTRIMNHLNEKFKTTLILKGGILLRLLNSPRSTQDLDYCWVRTKKRTLMAQEIKNVLENMDSIKVIDLQTNSRGIFLTVREETTKLLAKIEVSVISGLHLPPQPMSTAPLANRYSLKAQIITVMNLSEALSHKIAASLERDLIRDLYDLAQLEPLTSPDTSTLGDRLSNLEIGRTKPKKISLEKACELLQQKLDKLTQQRMSQEFGSNIPKEHLPGLETVIRASVIRIIQKLKGMGQF